MATSYRSLVVTLVVVGLSLAWLTLGAWSVIGIAATIVAFKFVEVMQSAADEVRQYEREQRPDLSY